jgi:hypothetical protein
MPITYEKIQSTTLGSANNQIQFTSIPGTYTDLRIVLVAQSVSDNDTGMRFNSDSGSNYSATIIYGNGTSAASSRASNQNSIPFFATALPISPNWGLITIDVFSYAGSTNKTCLTTVAHDKNGAGAIESNVALWRNTAAITSITLFQQSSGTFATGSTATLYGILKA